MLGTRRREDPWDRGFHQQRHGSGKGSSEQGLIQSYSSEDGRLRGRLERELEGELGPGLRGLVGLESHRQKK